MKRILFGLFFAFLLLFPLGCGKEKSIDLNGVIFESQTINYDGNKHSLSATNLPEGVTVSYDQKDLVDAGTYKIICSFYSNNGDFLGKKEATLTIIKETINPTEEDKKTETPSKEEGGTVLPFIPIN